jgi:hypothetical protein
VSGCSEGALRGGTCCFAHGGSQHSWSNSSNSTEESARSEPENDETACVNQSDEEVAKQITPSDDACGDDKVAASLLLLTTHAA